MKKALTFLLIFAISAATLTGCKNTDHPDATTGDTDSSAPGASEVKTPEEVYGDILAHRDNLRLTNVTETTDPTISVKITQEIAICGNLICTKASTELLGESQTVENYYVKTDTGTRLYFQEYGSWYDMSVPDADFDELADMENEENARMFASDYYGSYDPETGRYPLTDYSFGEAGELPLEDGSFQEGWLEIGDGIYTIHFVLTVAGQQMTSDMIFTDFGKVDLTLPTASSYTEPDGSAPDSTAESFVAPTPGEILELFESAESVIVNRELYSGEDCTYSESHYRQGNRHWILRCEDGGEEWTQQWTLDGTSDGYDFYEEFHVYDETGKWIANRCTKSEISSEQAKEYLPSYDALKALMKDVYYKAYDPESKQYVMKEGVSAEFGEYGSVSGVTVSVEELAFGLTVTFTVPVARDGAEGYWEIALYSFNSLIVEIPRVD